VDDLDPCLCLRFLEDGGGGVGCFLLVEDILSKRSSVAECE
jgi:hypothetical protein